jgi:hypothetical protein
MTPSSSTTTIQLLITNAAQILMALGVLVTAIGVLWNGRLALKNKQEIKDTRTDLTKQINGSNTKIDDNTAKTEQISKTIDGQLDEQRQLALVRAQEQQAAALVVAKIQSDKDAELKAADVARLELIAKLEQYEHTQGIIDDLKVQLAAALSGRRADDPVEIKIPEVPEPPKIKIAERSIVNTTFLETKDENPSN